MDVQVNAEIIRQGYGFALTTYPFRRLDEYRRLEREARIAGRGLRALDRPGALSVIATTGATGYRTTLCRLTPAITGAHGTWTMKDPLICASGRSHC